MVDDERQQELFLQGIQLTSKEFNQWLEQQPDKENLQKLVLQLQLERRGFQALLKTRLNAIALFSKAHVRGYRKGMQQ